MNRRPRRPAPIWKRRRPKGQSHRARQVPRRRCRRKRKLGDSPTLIRSPRGVRKSTHTPGGRCAGFAQPPARGMYGVHTLGGFLANSGSRRNRPLARSKQAIGILREEQVSGLAQVICSASAPAPCCRPRGSNGTASLWLIDPIRRVSHCSSGESIRRDDVKHSWDGTLIRDGRG